MNPQKDYSKYEPEVARAFITLHRKFGDQLHYFMDHHENVFDDDYHELELKLFQNKSGEDEIGVTAVDCEEKFNELIDDITAMGFGVETTGKIEKYKGEKLSVHNATLMGVTPVAEDADWNYPHILVRGSLTPAIEDGLNTYLGHRDVSLADIRNHYIIYGKEIDDIWLYRVADPLPYDKTKEIKRADTI